MSLYNKTRKKCYNNKKKIIKKGGKNKKKAITKTFKSPFLEAQKSYTKTGSLSAARQGFRSRGLSNARRLFGSITTSFT